jgi:NADPH-dependent curcumin reductase CurA
MSQTNRQCRLAQRPVGLPGDEVWTIVEEPVVQPADGQVLLRILYASIDPAMRGWINDVRSYIPPVAIGEVMRAGAVSRVEASAHPDYSVGDHVVGMQGIQQYALSDGRGLQRIDPELAPLPRYLGALGMPGMTAYFGLLEVGEPREGETVLVSGAAGAVGSLVGQIAKIKGCRAVGICGGEEKARQLTEELGFDAAIDYKNDDLREAVKAHCPSGVDVYFDNVGGEILEVALAHINQGARIPICGAISQYNNTEAPKGPANYLSLLVNRARMQGFIVFDYAPRYAEAAGQMARWMAEGKLQAREHIIEGIEQFPEGLRMLFDGRNQGKLVLKIAE